MDSLRRLWERVTGRRHRVWVHLTFADGRGKAIGPMDRYAAECFIVLRVAPSGAWDGRRVTSARIVRA